MTPPQWVPCGCALLAMACAPVHRYPDGTGIEGQLEREVVALTLRIRELESAADGAPTQAPDDGLSTELKQVFGGTDVVVEPSPGGTTLTVPTRLVFSDAIALRVRDESSMVVDLLATALAVHPEHHVSIVGHTSDRAIPRLRGVPVRDHLLLGAAQAHRFATALVDQGVDLARVTVGSRGAQAPVASNDLPEGQDANERLEVRLFRDGGLPP